MRPPWRLLAVLLLLLGGAGPVHAQATCQVQPANATDDTQALQTAMAQCAGGRIQLRPGEFRAGPLFLAAGTTFELTPGAVLYGIDDPPRYVRPDGGLYALINASDGSQVTIEGGGSIDGDGAGWWQRFRASQRDRQTPAPRPRLVVFERCTQVRVRNVTLSAANNHVLIPVSARVIGGAPEIPTTLSAVAPAAKPAA